VELKYDSFIPNKVQMKYAKYMLGVHKSATNIAVLAHLSQNSFNLFNKFCKPSADCDNNTISSAYNKHDTDLSLRSTKEGF
jgi:hypothetical protein